MIGGIFSLLIPEFLSPFLSCLSRPRLRRWALVDLWLWLHFVDDLYERRTKNMKAYAAHSMTNLIFNS